jgi:hypothetical protein
MPHPCKWDGILVVYGLGKADRTGRAGDLGANSVHIFSLSPPYIAFLTVANRADGIASPFGPLPSQAFHGYGVSRAYHGEARGCRRACERTPPARPPPLCRRRALLYDLELVIAFSSVRVTPVRLSRWHECCAGSRSHFKQVLQHALTHTGCYRCIADITCGCLKYCVKY